MKIIILFFALATSSLVFSQTDAEKLRDELKKQDALHDSLLPKKYWTYTSLFGLSGSQTAFVNWAAGGRNNIAVLSFINFSATYEKRRLKWTNDVALALGGMYYTDSTGKKQGLQKTDDRIDLASSFGYEFKKHWFLTALGGFRTQFLNGFSFPNDSVPISKFMAPGYVNFSLGIEYAPVDYFSVYLSPIASKMTFVRDQRLANAGAFGVKAAELDESGNILKPGLRFRSEIGAYFRVRFQKEIFKNVEMKTRLELFSNYEHNPQNIDVNFENIFTFKVNKWLQASLQWNLIYDDDIQIRDSKGRTGPRTQFKSVLGLGISYTLTNKKK
ncbi:DUF3078 domain-containing protein [Fluviicola sp.]|uniref:DUF3078 domain-containing protein n=1 Tax=Fluviicola sp. TaxID=1917219 RepID=UPI002604761F|nr:DUF3078 domain-containing protein [Fluviicola sp.]